MDRASRLKRGANVRSLSYRCANSWHIVAVELLQAAGMMDDGEAFFSKPTGILAGRPVRRPGSALALS